MGVKNAKEIDWVLRLCLLDLLNWYEIDNEKRDSIKIKRTGGTNLSRLIISGAGAGATPLEFIYQHSRILHYVNISQ